MDIPKLTVIAHLQSPYREKFAIPRQPGLADAAEGFVALTDLCNDANCLRGLEQASHLWLLFLFHHHFDKGWQPTVRPPRLGGNKRLGVFASRSTFRPNPIGMSVVTNLGIECRRGRWGIRVGGPDMTDGTPIIDIKPYVPYSDCLPQADFQLARQAPAASLEVVFSPAAEAQLNQWDTQGRFRRLIRQVLSQDPRPAYRRQTEDKKIYAIWLEQWNIRWRVEHSKVLVLALEPRP